MLRRLLGVVLLAMLSFVAISASAGQAKANRYGKLDVVLHEKDQAVVFPLGYDLAIVERELDPIKLAIKNQLK